MKKASQVAKKKRTLVNTYDHFMYVVGVGGTVVFLPQLIKIWSEKNASGLSLLSWVGFLLGSLIWLFYGIVHKQKPIIFINVIVASLQSLIVLGIILYGQ